MSEKTSQSKLNKEYLEDAQSYMDEWMKDPEFRAAYEVEGLRIQIAELVRSRRKALSLTQAMLAEKAKTNQKVISRIENGSVSVGVDLLQRIGEALGSRVLIKFGKEVITS